MIVSGAALPGVLVGGLIERLKKIAGRPAAQKDTAALRFKELITLIEKGHEMSPTSPPADHIMQFFAYSHLPPHLQAVSKPFCDLALAIVGDERGMPEGTPTQFPLPRNPERTVALRKLLEAKDAAVRALLAKEPEPAERPREG